MAILAVCILSTGTVFAGGGTLKNLGNGICQDQEKGLMWEIAYSKRFSNAEDVKKYVSDLKLGGYDDWRLPTTLESCELRGLIAIQGNEGCNIPKLESKYWLEDKKKGTVPARLELECFCRGDYDMIVKDKGYVRVVRFAKTSK